MSYVLTSEVYRSKRKEIGIQISHNMKLIRLNVFAKKVTLFLFIPV